MFREIRTREKITDKTEETQKQTVKISPELEKQFNESKQFLRDLFNSFEG